MDRLIFGLLFDLWQGSRTRAAGKTLYSGDYARQLADSRIGEMDAFLTRLDAESYGRKHL